MCYINKTIFIIIILCISNITTVYGDSYIDRVSGNILGTDGATTDNLRVIDIREWNYVIEEKEGTYSNAGIIELHKNSFVIEINEDQIQNEIQKMTEDSVEEGLENQIFIVLNVNTGKVFALRDKIEEGKSKRKIIINTYTVGFNSAPRVGEGLMLLAQIHTHPKEDRENKKNVRSVSDSDISVAKNLGISVFAIDAFSFSNAYKFNIYTEDSSAFHLHATKDGISNEFVGQTRGEKGLNTFNFSTYLEKILRSKSKKVTTISF